MATAQATAPALVPAAAPAAEDSGRPKKKPRKKQEYVPGVGTANYAFLILLYQVLGQQCSIAFPFYSSTVNLYMTNSLDVRVLRQDQAMAPDHGRHT
jgi:hypothetical protein